MPFAYWIIEKISPKVFVELGTHTGASYFAFCQSIASNKTGTKAFAVDTWQGDEHAGFYDETVFQSVAEANELYKSFSTLLRTTFDEASSSFDDKSIDLLHIDGLHTYSAVKHDFETWLPKLAPNAVVLFHDTNVHRDDFGVYKFWAEISAKHPSMEFFHYHGLGVLQMSDSDKSFIPAGTDDQQILRNRFEGLSQSMLVKFERDRLVNERDGLAAERDGLAAERDGLAAERDGLSTERYNLAVERDQLVAERNLLISERSEMTAERERLRSELQAIFNTKLWRSTKGIRSLITKLRP
jgi:hypothetical protein